tara:strand:- start:532 stop:1443 length:912 start_codon:yes stop_codon:yes gene_type:complete
MKKPIHLEYLKKGDLIAVVSIAKYIKKKECQFAIQYIKKKGLKVFDLDKTILSRRGMFSGSDKERVEMLQFILDSPKVKAIFFARGGYGSIRILDKLNFNLFIKNPKWLIGFSDVTVFLSHVSKLYNFSTIHGPMPFNFPNTSRKSLEELFNLLFGITNTIKIKGNKYNREGVSNGKLIGGNLSILCSLLNSNSFPKTKGNILLIEDVGEYLYSIDRMIYSLKRSGVFENISGLIVGKFSKTKDNKPSFGQNIHEIIIQALSEYNFPICFDFPFGHVKNNKPLLLFKNVQLKIRKSVQLIYTN